MHDRVMHAGLRLTVTNETVTLILPLEATTMNNPSESSGVTVGVTEGALIY